MNKTSQIKTHFDSKIIVFFITFFMFSCILLMYKKMTSSDCNVSGFKIEAKTFAAGEIITFADTTKKASQWRWDFGDGSEVSYLSKAPHVFEKEGKYIVRLLVNKNCSAEKEIDIKPREIKVDNSLMPVFVVPKNITVGVPVTFRDITPHAKSWQWIFGESAGDPSKFDATDKNPTYTFKSAGPKKITLAVNGDYKYVKKVDIFVREKKQDVVKPIEKIVVQPQNVGPEKPGVTEADIEAMLRGISKGELSYRNFSKSFCKKNMPEVHLKDGRIVSLKELDENIRDKGSIKVKQVTMQKDANGCVTRLDVNYKN